MADGVELVPEVVESFPLFERSAPQLGRNPDLRIHVADARRFVRAAGDRYDVIVADLYHPSVDGSGALYAREHFAAIRARLAEGGLFCQWLPLHQLDLATLRVIVRTFLAEFPDSAAYLAQFSVETPLIALVGTQAPKTYPADWLGRRVEDACSARAARSARPEGRYRPVRPLSRRRATSCAPSPDPVRSTATTGRLSRPRRRASPMPWPTRRAPASSRCSAHCARNPMTS